MVCDKATRATRSSHRCSSMRARCQLVASSSSISDKMYYVAHCAYVKAVTLQPPFAMFDSQATEGGRGGPSFNETHGRYRTRGVEVDDRVSLPRPAHRHEKSTARDVTTCVRRGTCRVGCCPTIRAWLTCSTDRGLKRPGRPYRPRARRQRQHQTTYQTPHPAS